jgi:hypothetical protein
MNIEEKIRYAVAKIRNIIYYRLEVEESMLDDRYRCQYMHVLRKYRKSLLGLIEELDNTDTRKSFFKGLIDIINPKVKTDECKETIEALKDYYDTYVKQ